VSFTIGLLLVGLVTPLVVLVLLVGLVTPLVVLVLLVGLALLLFLFAFKAISCFLMVVILLEWFLT
jgi:hypothetical protein